MSGYGTNAELIAKQLADAAAVKRVWGGLMYVVTNYGIIGDGVTNNTSALQALINEAIAAGRRTIFFPHGVYFVESLMNADQVDFVGDNSTFTGGYSGEIANLGSDAALKAEFEKLKGENATDGPRPLILWAGAQSVQVFGSEFSMGGFRFLGKMRHARGKYVKSPVRYRSLSMNTDLSLGMTSPKTSNWYAIFACANENDTAPTFKLVPFLKVKSVAGSVVTLGMCGEDIAKASGDITAATYSWGNNALSDLEVLIITEGASNSFSGRYAKITANTATTITLNAIGSISPRDLLLPAPSGFDHYSYLGSFYYDTAEIRNRYDTGNIVRSRMVDVAFYHGNNGSQPTYLDGAIPQGSAKKITLGGFISPLATGVIISDSQYLATSGTGEAATYYDADAANHVVETIYHNKTSTSAETRVSNSFVIGFNGAQQYFVWTGGALASQRAYCANNILGWIEP